MNPDNTGGAARSAPLGPSPDAGRDAGSDATPRLRAGSLRRVPEDSVTNGQAEDAAERRRWLVLVYRVPTEPTRLRAGVWRRLKGLGAIYLQNSVAALPASVGAERALRTLRNEIAEMGGTAHVLTAGVLAGEADVVAAFNAARDDEYAEIVDRCQDFVAQVEKEYVAKHFSYAELEENDEDLVKLRNWYAKVQHRDVLGAGGMQAVIDALAICERTLEDYATRVYAEEGESR
jgi:DNA-binding transcriptional regulator PaaX